MIKIKQIDTIQLSHSFLFYCNYVAPEYSSFFSSISAATQFHSEPPETWIQK